MHKGVWTMGKGRYLSTAPLALCLAVAAASAPSSAQQPQKPNVVFILADNVGYGDLGPYGGGELRGAPTPRIDQLAQEGLRLTQFLVEPACTPSRTALMTGQYSIRNGLSLVVIEGSQYTLPARAFTMGELFKGAGYATAIFGKWHLGGAPQSLPTAHGFDEFYGIPPDISWDSATYVSTIELTHSIAAPPGELLACGPQIVEASAGSPLRKVKPYTPRCAPTSITSWSTNQLTSCDDRKLPGSRSSSTCRSQWGIYRICRPASSPGKVKPNTTSYAMFSIMDFLPTFAHIVGGAMPTDRPIDGVDQIDVLLGNSAMGHRESLLSFI